MNPAFKDVCRNQDCLELMRKTCEKVLPCGHPCCGFVNELLCLPCLDPGCVKRATEKTLSKNCDEFCEICYTAGLGQAPCVQLKCKHIFHVDCITTRVKGKWPGPRIVFGFLDCPACKQRIEAPHCPELQAELAISLTIEKDVSTKALERAKHEGIDKDPRLSDQNDPYYQNLQKWALFKLAYYQCFKCKGPYFGGLKDCVRA
jgi:Ring finger domain